MAVFNDLIDMLLVIIVLMLTLMFLITAYSNNFFEEKISGCESIKVKAQYEDTKCTTACAVLGDTWSEISEECKEDGEVCCVTKKGDSLKSTIRTTVVLGNTILKPGENKITLEEFRDGLSVDCLGDGEAYKVSLSYEGFDVNNINTLPEEEHCVGKYSFPLAKDKYMDILTAKEGVLTITIEMFKFSGPVKFHAGDTYSERAEYTVRVS